MFLGQELTDTTVAIIGNTFDGPGLELKSAIKYLGDHPLRVVENTFKEHKNAVLLQSGSGMDVPAPVITVNNVHQRGLRGVEPSRPQGYGDGECHDELVGQPHRA